MLLLATLAINVRGAGAAPASIPWDRAPATIRVRLPADAELTFDGHITHSKSAERLFMTPPLPRGRAFRYAVKCQFIRAGMKITVEEDITVQAGRETRVSLDVPREVPTDTEWPGRYDSSERAGLGTRVSYYSLPATLATPTSVNLPTVVVPAAGVGAIPAASPPRPRSFEPIHWGPDPSDPFYHSYGH
jgi:uncharacterized protein (TIGR03000 family)